MSQVSDYYAILGIRRDATKEQIKRSYLEAAQRLHPDRNMAPGDTEIFLEVQQAYETLYNPRRRREYDATLPPEETSSGPILHEILYSRPQLVRLDEDQLIYALVTLHARHEEEALPVPPLNVCLVLDRSTSMKDEKMDLLKAAAIHFLRDMREEDIFSVVAFSDRAEVIIPAAHPRERQKLESRIRDIQAGGATELLQGLKAGLKEVQQGVDAQQVNHIILLTDGHTYGDEADCLELAGAASQSGIGISAMGLGAGWNDNFLDQVAGRTGNTSHYIAKPQDIHRLLSEKFRDLSRLIAEEVTLEGKLGDGVLLQDVFRLQPESGPVSPGNSMNLGPIQRDVGLSVLFEFTVQPAALMSNMAGLLDGTLKITMASRPVPPPPIPLNLARAVEEEPGDAPPPHDIVQALSRLTLYRMQERARKESQEGKVENATRSLKNLAAHLLEQGHQEIANTVLLEAENLQRKGSFSPAGDKEIKYATRALLMEGKTKE